nr:unnamed protein product [Callosobruchus analis]
MTLPSLYIFHQLVDIHKHRLCFNLNSNFHSYETRSAGLIRKPRFRLDKSRKNSPQLALYNLLPEAIKALSLSLFKKHIKAFLLRNAFYSVEECYLACQNPEVNVL